MKIVGKYARTAAFGTALGAALLLTAGLGMAQAQPTPPTPPPPGPAGMISVVVGGVMTMDNVPRAQAAQAVTQLCAMPEAAASAVVARVNSPGGRQTACTAQGGAVELVQNLPGVGEGSPVVPGTKALIKSDPAQDIPAGGGKIGNSLPTAPDNMSSKN
ncbi:MAG: hypothetical protein WBB07_15690 [Mycobacterium sp.]